MNANGSKLEISPAIKPNARGDVLGDMELDLHERFYPLGFPVDIISNRREVFTAARESFGHRTPCYDSDPLSIKIGVSRGNATCPPLPVRRQYDHLYLMLADVQNQAVLDLRTGANFIWVSDGALTDTTYLRHNFLEKVTYLLLGARFVTDVHAACVSRHGKGVLLCGESGAGKSTLSYGCARTGWTFTSDDTCYLINAARTPRVIGHAHRVRFRPSAAELFPELQGRTVVERMEGKPSIEVPICELPVADTATEANVCAIVYLRRDQTTNAQLFRLPRGSATARMSQDLYSAGNIRTKHEKSLEQFANTPVFELHYCGLDDALQYLNRLVDGL